jgi:murein DD-endopeptidase MepM/ murein hydrolase activator NlpD
VIIAIIIYAVILFSLVTMYNRDKYTESLEAQLRAHELSAARARMLSAWAVPRIPERFEVAEMRRRIRTQLYWPIDPEDYVERSSPFGERDPADIGGYGDYFHNGLDAYGTYQARIRPIADGRVVFVGSNAVLGNYVIIRHWINGVRYFSLSGHLYSIEVEIGDTVEGGKTLVGRQGRTGKTASAHLHLDIIKGGRLDVETGDIIGGVLVNPDRILTAPDARR